MRAAYQVHVIRYRVIHRNKAGLNGCTNTDRRATTDGNYCLMGHKAIDLYANVASGEVVVVESVNCNAICCDAERIYRVRREQVRVPDSGGLCQIVETAACGVQNVLRETNSRRQ